jgi:peroxiredoxin
MKELGTRAPDFALRDVVSGKTVTRKDVSGSRGMLVMFICRHCPFVKHVQDELAKIGRDYVGRGVGIVAISSNDVASHPEDSPTKLAYQAQELQFTFPYLFDESQDVARAYGAKTTPDVFVVDSGGALRYRGAPDPDSGDPTMNATWLREALDAMLAGQEIARPETEPVGCSIKWK